MLTQKHQTAYPFSAIVGQEAMKRALLLAVVDPSIGGVLISGHKGTGKSTVVRALRALLPPLEVVAGCRFACDPAAPEAFEDECRQRRQRGDALGATRAATPFVELPLNATEDRVAGTLDVERALRDGVRRFDPGLLAAAHRGILYVDEVNLLEDHLVDLLLDAAASGRNTVEREGISFSHASRFVLIGTMNPEEGSLRPQFLDRFGLFVAVDSATDVAQRVAIARRRLAFDSDAAGFNERWRTEEETLATRLVAAREALQGVEVPEEATELAVRLAVAAGARGHRAEIAMLKAARALAALAEQTAVTSEQLAEAARLVLPHRMQAGPLESPEQLAGRLTELIQRELAGLPPPSQAVVEACDADDDWLGEAMQVPGATAAGSITFEPQKKSPKSV